MPVAGGHLPAASSSRVVLGLPGGCLWREVGGCVGEYTDEYADAVVRGRGETVHVNPRYVLVCEGFFGTTPPCTFSK